MYKNQIKHIPVFSKIDLSDDGQVLIFPHSAAILGVLDDGRILLVEQYRKPVNRNTFELPGGKVEIGEDLTQAAQRELLEETGYSSKDISLVLSLDMDFSVSKHITHVFFAILQAHVDQIEDTKLHKVQLDEALDMVSQGTISHAPTVAALLWLKNQGADNE